MKWMCCYDIIFLSEVKRRVTSAPGFVVFEARNENYSRGGLVLFIKSSLAPSICKLDNSINEQIWFELDSLPNIVFGGVYIPPTDSIYYHEESFSHLQGKTFDSSKAYIFGGDLNTRIGNTVHILDDDNISHSVSDDVINSHGRKLTQICYDNNLQIVNSQRQLSSGPRK